MIEQTATVIAVENGQLVLETRPQSTCQSCAVNKGCGTAMLSKRVGRKVVHWRLANTLGAQPGDTVVLGLEENALLKGSLILYLLPLVMMIVVAVVADRVMTPDAEYRDAAIALLSLSSVAASVLLGRWLFRRGDSSQRYTPMLLRKQIDTTIVTPG